MFDNGQGQSCDELSSGGWLTPRCAQGWRLFEEALFQRDRVAAISARHELFHTSDIIHQQTAHSTAVGPWLAACLDLTTREEHAVCLCFNESISPRIGDSFIRKLYHWCSYGRRSLQDSGMYVPQILDWGLGTDGYSLPLRCLRMEIKPKKTFH